MAVLSPGDSTIVDSSRSWFSDCQGQSSRLYLRVPVSMLHGRLRTRRLPVLPHIHGQCGIGATLSRFAVSLYEQSEHMQLEEGTAAVQAYFDLLSVCMGHRSGTPLSRNSLLARAETVIENLLAEPTLEPGVIACAIGVSTRHLHRLFSSKKCTVTEWIRERRLEKCRIDLSEAVGASITDIAFRWGFSDSAHFSRIFKNKFGVSPREYRERQSLSRGTTQLQRRLGRAAEFNSVSPE